ncbi:hypothetical protein SADUNF_Sadunf07G0043200 [Salix dunnii]|uniref:Uncharacterized protein n=1 Tax=Salix dunnii TaxID=1413687 RepID=A0A835N283_9ROSI|nr:hypothetical protein SADUNF_Sadunf07G0043200 [Salix dunnii]
MTSFTSALSSFSIWSSREDLWFKILFLGEAKAVLVDAVAAVVCELPSSAKDKVIPSIRSIILQSDLLRPDWTCSLLLDLTGPRINTVNSKG